jgi:hypothetical protein
MELITTQNSQTFIQTLNNPNSHGAILKAFKTTIKEIRESYPSRELINRGANKGHLEALVSVMVMRAASFISTGGNLREGQALIIAQNILNDYPLLSLEDINLLLLNGVKGKYGPIYRMDISVIYDWIRAFEEEKAEDREVVIKKEEKTQEAGEITPQTQEMIDNFLKNLKGPQSVPNVSRLEIANAKEPLKPKSLSTNYVFNPDADRLIELKIQYGRLHADPYTGRTKEGHPTFQEFLKNN